MFGNNLAVLGSSPWEQEAKKMGYRLPKVIPGVTLIDFRDENPENLYNNRDLLKAQPRISGEDPAHTRELARHIQEDGLEEPLIVVSCIRTGKPIPLTHHRVGAVIELGWDTVPCFEVKIDPYQDAKGRTHYREEILKDYTSASPGALNRPKGLQKPLEIKDHVRALKDKEGYGEFASAKTPEEIVEQARNYVEVNWGHLDKTTKGKIFEQYKNGVIPEKIRTYTAGTLRKRYSQVPKGNTWDYDSNVLNVMCHGTAITASWGLWLNELRSGTGKALADNESMADIEKKINTVKVVLWCYVAKAQ